MANNSHVKPARDKVLRACALRALGHTIQEAGEDMGVKPSTISSWTLEWSRTYKIKPAEIDALATELSPRVPPAPAEAEDQSKRESLRVILRRGQHAPFDLAKRLGVTKARIKSMLQELRNRGLLVTEASGLYSIAGSPAPAIITAKHLYKSRPGGYYKFGYTTDNHLCSKYAREEVLNDLYDWFAAEKVDVVFNTGNYIDGEARFNKHDIFVHGMQNQLNYFCEKYPRRKGLITKFIAGDDHEGWYGQREGVDIGWLTEQTAREKYKREDLVHLGYMEAFVRMQHADFKQATNHLLLVHPGGGSAYATSYAPQKYVEALQGGEKPAVILFGHWHKIFDLLIRNVICLGGGCTKDVDTFGRKMKLAYHVGGMIVELWQDEAGAVNRWRVEKKQYFDRGYYNEQWSYTGMPSRTPI